MCGHGSISGHCQHRSNDGGPGFHPQLFHDDSDMMADRVDAGIGGSCSVREGGLLFQRFHKVIGFGDGGAHAGEKRLDVPLNLLRTSA